MLAVGLHRAPAICPMNYSGRVLQMKGKYFKFGTELFLMALIGFDFPSVTHVLLWGHSEMQTSNLVSGVCFFLHEGSIISP